MKISRGLTVTVVGAFSFVTVGGAFRQIATGEEVDLPPVPVNGLASALSSLTTGTGSVAIGDTGPTYYVTFVPYVDETIVGGEIAIVAPALPGVIVKDA